MDGGGLRPTRLKPVHTGESRKRRWVTPLRLAISLGLLALLFSRIGGSVTWSDLVPTWNLANVLLLVGAAVLMLFSYALATVRWHQVIGVLGLSDGLGRLLRHFLAGQFLSNALPTTIGGDVVRIARLARDTGDTPTSFASVLLERMTGWIVLPLLTFTGLLLNPDLRELGPQSLTVAVVAVATLVGLLGVGLMVYSKRLGGRLNGNTGWRRFAGALHLGIVRLRQNPLGAIGVLLAGLAYQFVLVMVAYLLSEALGMDIGITVMLAFFPAVLIVQVLPIPTISGLGVREAMLVFLLEPLGIPKEPALALGLIFWVMTVITSLVGAPFYALGGGRPAHLPQDDMDLEQFPGPDSTTASPGDDLELSKG